MINAAAARTFNVLASEGRRVVAGFVSNPDHVSPCRGAAGFLIFAITACSHPAQLPRKHGFERWLAAGHRAQTQQYRAFLQREGTADVVPMGALSRTSRRWRLCMHDEFSTPPPALWQNMPPTLQVVRELRDAGILDPTLARSVYRNETIIHALAAAPAASIAKTKRSISIWHRMQRMSRDCANSGGSRDLL